MDLVLIIIYVLTLIYFFLSERITKFIWLLSIQGFLLFGIAFLNLIHIQPVGLILILLETVVVKAIAIPWFINKIRKANKLKRVHESVIPVFYSVIFITVIIVLSFVISTGLANDNINVKFFTVALASIFGGIYFVIIHKNILSHLVGYLILENGIFLLSLAVSSEMPIMVSLAVLLDIFVGILAIGLFINQVGNTFQSTSVDKLSQLKD